MKQAARQRKEKLAERASALVRDNLVIKEYNCAESTFWGIMSALELPMDEAVMRVATPFGGELRIVC